jgi:hypothetical protein
MKPPFKRHTLYIVSGILMLMCARTLPAQKPDTVKAGAYVISVHDINFHDKEYTIRFWLWFLYDNKDFDFAKQLDIPNAKSIEPPEVSVDRIDGIYWAMLKMKGTMKESWKVADFPFDSQHLRVQIENSLYNKDELVFKPDFDGSKYEKEITIDGWNIRNFKVNTKISAYETAFGDFRLPNQHSEFAAFIIEMDIERDAWGMFFKIFSGMYIAFLIAIISFTPNPWELEPRFGLPVGGLFAAVGNKYIIDSLLPESSEFTLVDTLHSLTFFAIFATLVVSALALRYHDLGKKQACLNVNKYGSRLVIAVYVLLNIAFIWLAII